MRAMDLQHWPPHYGWMVNAHGAYLQALSADQAAIERVVRVVDTHVIFTCQFDGNTVYYDFEAENARLADSIAEILRANVGMVLRSVGMVEISNRAA
jgi:hypothetical protein